VINIGTTNSIINLRGTTTSIFTVDLIVRDPTITLNSGGAADSAGDAGIEFEEANIKTGYMKVSSNRNYFHFKPPGSNVGEVVLADINTGDISLRSTLNVSGNTTLLGPITGISSLNISGNTTLSGPLTCVSSLNVSGNVNLSSVGINGPLTILSSLNVSGLSTFESNLLIKQPVTMISTLIISGAQTNTSTINISGLTILESNMLVKQPVTMGSNLTINGSQTNVSTLNISGLTTIESNLLIKQSGTFSSNLTINGNQTIISNLNISGTATLESNLLVKQPITILSDLTIIGTQTNLSIINISGLATFESNVLMKQRVTIGSSLTTNGVQTSLSAMNISGSTIMESNLLVKQSMTNLSSLTVTGSQTNISSLNVSGSSFFNSAVSMGTRLNIGSTSNTSTLNVRNNSSEIADFRSDDNESFITVGNYGSPTKAGYISYVSSSSQIRIGQRRVTDIVYINTSGNTNFGIGQSNPTAKLHVSGTSYLDGVTQIYNSAGSNYDDNLRLPPSNGGFATIHMGNVAGTNTGTGNGQWSLLRCDTGLDNDFQIRHNGSTVMHLKKNGNIGIGIVNPSTILHISGTTILNGATTISSTLNVSSNTILNNLFIPNLSSVTSLAVNSSGQIIQGSASSQWTTNGNDIYYNTGNIGIGVTNPTNARLHISGSQSYNAGTGNTAIYVNNTWGFYYASSDGSLGYSAGGNVRFPISYGNDNTSRNYSIYASDGIVASFVTMFSDERIKKNITDIDKNIALLKLKSIQPKNYYYKDSISNGNKKEFGFIAQQVNDVIPEAIDTVIDFIPNINILCTFINNIINIPNHCLIDGDLIRIFDKDNKQYNLIVKVQDINNVKVLLTTEEKECLLVSLNNKLTNKKNQKETIMNQIIESSTSIEMKNILFKQIQQINRDLTQLYYIIDNFELMNNLNGFNNGNLNKIFVYGKQITDFHSLNKDHIFTINVAATQELDKQLCLAKQEIEQLKQSHESLNDTIRKQNHEKIELKNEILELKNKINDILIQNNQFKSLFANIESRLIAANL
jgi:hypothetical protein